MDVSFSIYLSLNTTHGCFSHLLNSEDNTWMKMLNKNNCDYLFVRSLSLIGSPYNTDIKQVSVCRPYGASGTIILFD